jgi:hypothetical protein
MVDSQFNIIANLEFKSNLASIKESTDRINLLSKQISNLSKEIATVRTGPLTEINNKIRDQLHAINPLNNALAIYNKLSYRQGKGEDLSQRETKSLEDAKSSLKELTGMTQHVDALRKSREDVFFGKQQLTAFRQTKSEIIAGLQELLNKKGKLTAERGELKLRVDMAKPGAMGEIDTKNLEIAQDLMKRTGLEANALTIGLKRLGMAIKGGKIIGPFNKEIKVAEINLKKLKAASVQFKMSLLSVMFAGMALQRVMGKALRSMITTYQKANEDSEGLGKSTWHLQAAFEFLKYSIVEALTQSPLFQMLVQWLVQVVAWFNKLSPDTKAMIGIGIAIVFVIGTLMLLVGQIGLAINGFAAMGISGGGAILGIVGKMLMWLAIAIAVGFIIKGLFKGFTDGTKQASGEGISFGKILGFMAQSFLFLMRILETGARIIGNGFMQMIDGLKSSFYMLKWLFGTIMNYVIDKFESVINGIIKGINAAIRGANALGARIKEVPELNIGFRADTEGALDEISKLGEQIKSRAAQLYNEMPDLKTLWEQSDVSGLVTPSGQVNQDNSVKVDVGAINVQGASEEVMRDANSLASTIKDQIMNEINDTYSQLNDSTS